MNKKEESEFLSSYFDEFYKCSYGNFKSELLLNAANLIKETSRKARKVFFVGNGASASIANHCALDFTKQAKIRSISFSDSAFLTAYGNDFGYEKWVERALVHHSDPGDTVILISSSGTSQNIINGAKAAKEIGLSTITLSGFEKGNPLNSLGDINLWADSRSYNIVEATHTLWLVAICDLIIGKKEYSVS